MADALDLPRLPRRIECFDISNIQGTNPVASMVVFEDGRPRRRSTAASTSRRSSAANDFAMMPEVIRRRFRRAVEEVEARTRSRRQDGRPCPIWSSSTAARASSTPRWRPWTSSNVINVPIVGLAKENEELFLPGQPDPVILPRDSQALFLVQRVRDEAHRFAVTFHQQTRSKATFHSQLDDVPGIGPKRKKALIQHFGSVKRLRAARSRRSPPSTASARHWRRRSRTGSDDDAVMRDE